VTRAIGRDEGCWLRLENTSVSRRHALVSRRGDACRIRDLGSTNGTLVNGAAVTVAELLPGDEVRLGEVALYVR
jgi:pSer/pThr/pTyr-binding forkhead associated (FHA) protein